MGPLGGQGEASFCGCRALFARALELSEEAVHGDRGIVCIFFAARARGVHASPPPTTSATQRELSKLSNFVITAVRRVLTCNLNLRQDAEY